MSTIFILILLAFIASVGLSVWQWFRLRHIEQQFGTFFTSTDKRSIMQAMNQYADTIKQHGEQITSLSEHAKQLKLISERAHTRVGFVRFNPFSDTGGDQSFCLAVLDAEGSGWVLSSIHARTGNRVYAKQLVLGKSSHTLSEEEATAVTKALKVNPYHAGK